MSMPRQVLMIVNSGKHTTSVKWLDMDIEQAFMKEVVPRDLFVYAQPCWQRQIGYMHLLSL